MRDHHIYPAGLHLLLLLGHDKDHTQAGIDVEVQHRARDSITVGWTKTESDGGKPITG